MLRDHSNNAHSARLEWCGPSALSPVLAPPTAQSSPPFVPIRSALRGACCLMQAVGVFPISWLGCFPPDMLRGVSIGSWVGAGSLSS